MATARQLRVLVPPVWPIRVRRTQLEDSYGDCTFFRGGNRQEPYFMIRIAKGMGPAAETLVLVHEWAHALSWGSDSHRIRSHGPEWGIALSRIWQALYED